jgi:hypothetical protein
MKFIKQKVTPFETSKESDSIFTNRRNILRT